MTVILKNINLPSFSLTEISDSFSWFQIIYVVPKLKKKHLILASLKILGKFLFNLFLVCY